MQLTKNLLIFFLAAALLGLGWWQLRDQVLPENKPAEQGKKKKERKRTDPKSEKAPAAPAAIAAALTGARAGLDRTGFIPAQPTAEAAVRAGVAAAGRVAVAAIARLVALGSREPDSKFHLGVILDPRGAGVRSVVLNKFQEADVEGKPEWKDRKKREYKPLELVPALSNRLLPSHLLYHFDPNAPDSNRPLETLGLEVWKTVKPLSTEKIAGKERQSVSFAASAAGVTITKTFSLTEGEYHLGLSVTLRREAKSAKDLRFRYQLTGAHGLPIEGRWYTGTYRNALIAQEDEKGTIHRDLQELRQISLQQGGYKVEPESGRILRYAGVATQYFASAIVVDRRHENKQNILERARPTLETAIAKGKIINPGEAADKVVLTDSDGKDPQTIYLPPALQGRLLGLKEKTALAIIYRPASYDERLKECPRYALEVLTGDEAEATHALWEDDITVRVSTRPESLAPGEQVTHHYLLYNGPVKPSLLRQLSGDKKVDGDVIDLYVDDLQLNTLTDYHSPGVMGKIARFIRWTPLLIAVTNLMHWILGGLYSVIPNLGLCILLLTVIVRVIMFPISRKQAIMGLKMQELQPELKKLSEKLKGDRQAMGMAQMELYRKHGINPFGTCWFMLLQMPVFMGLYYALQESILFRLGGFWPTWVDNLAAPDMLIRWGESIPLISSKASFGGFLYLGPYFNILPVVAVALMVVQMKMMTPPAVDEQQAMQQKMMTYMMVFFGLMFYKVAAGLCLYFIASSLWGFAERKLLPKAKTPTVGVDLAAAAAAVPAAGGATSDQIATGTSTAVQPAGGVQARKPGKSKRKGGKREEEQPATGLGRLRQRLSDWWQGVLDQARKK